MPTIRCSISRLGLPVALLISLPLARAGDFNGDGYPDLAIGCPSDLVGTQDHAGSVTVLGGAPGGLFSDSMLVHQDVADVPDVAEDGDQLGSALAAADYDGDGRAELIIGVPYENISGVGTAGGVLVLEGSASLFFDLTQSHWLEKSLPSIAGSPGSNDTFGSALGL